jgi:hypothetical protein
LGKSDSEKESTTAGHVPQHLIDKRMDCFGVRRWDHMT